MSRLFFALVDAVLWSRWVETYSLNRRIRATFRKDHHMRRVFHENMEHSRTSAVGEWRSLWGVL